MFINEITIRSRHAPIALYSTSNHNHPRILLTFTKVVLSICGQFCLIQVLHYLMTSVYLLFAFNARNASLLVLFVSPNRDLLEFHACHGFAYLWLRQFPLSHSGLSSTWLYTHRCNLWPESFATDDQFHVCVIEACVGDEVRILSALTPVAVV